MIALLLVLACQDTETIGLGARARAMGGTGAASSEGPEALYYNPAALARVRVVSAAADFALLVPFTDVRSSNASFDDNAEGELDLRGYVAIGAAGPLIYDPCPECDKSNARTVHPCPACGKEFAPPTETDWLDGFYWGIQITFPTSVGTSVRATSKQDDPEWVSYTRSGLLASAGAAYRFNDWLVAGLSAHLLTVTSGEVLNEIITFSGTPSHITFETETRYVGSITLGLLLTPLDPLHVGLCYRSERVLNVENTSTTKVDTLGAVVVTSLLMEVTSTFSPQQFALGVEWEISPKWSVAADLTWSDWSEYVGPYSFLTVQPETTSGVSVTPHPRVNASDTWTPSLGVEFRPSAAWTIRAGYRFRPSPISEQDGSTNLIDSAAHLVSAGVAHRLSRTVLLESYVQLHLLAGQSVRERDASATPNAWEMEGGLFLAGVGIRVYF